MEQATNERLLDQFVLCADRLALTNIVLTRDSGKFSVEDLTALLLSTGDFPKTKSFA